MNITKITITKETFANGRFDNTYYQILINYDNGTHDIFNVYEIDEVLKFIEEHKR